MTDKLTTTEQGAVALSTPSELLRIAVEGNADIDKLEKLMELQARYEDREAKKAFIAAMAGFQAECPVIDKADSVSYNKTNYNFANLGAIVEATKSLLQKHGLAFRFEMSEDNGALSVKCIITHTGGHSEANEMSAPLDTSGSKNAIQSRGSTSTYLQRYTLCGALGIVTANQDNDANVPEEVINAKQVKQLVSLIAKAGSDMNKVLAYGNVDSFEKFPLAKFDRTVKGLNHTIESNLDLGDK